MPDEPTNDPPLVPQEPARGRTIKSDETLFSIIDVLQEEGPSTLTEIANAAGIVKSAAYKHLTTLQRHGFVTAEDGNYRIGLRFLEIGIREQQSRTLYPVVEPKLNELAKDTDKLVWCIIEENGLGVFLCGAEGEHSVATDAIPGSRMHMHYTSGGKAILAHMDEEEVRDIVDRYGLPKKTESTITDEEELFDQLRDIRERGFAVEFEESLYGLNSVGAPILSEAGDPLGAIIVAGAARRMSRDVCKNEIADAVLAVVNEIELDLQYS